MQAARNDVGSTLSKTMRKATLFAAHALRRAKSLDEPGATQRNYDDDVKGDGRRRVGCAATTQWRRGRSHSNLKREGGTTLIVKRIYGIFVACMRASAAVSIFSSPQ